MLRDDVLMENNKYGWVIMQNNWAMKIVNFMHAQTAENFPPSVNAGYEASKIPAYESCKLPGILEKTI